MSIVFTPLAPPNYSEFIRLYEAAFPPEERRPYAGPCALGAFMQANADAFRALAAMRGPQLIGFITFWEFPDYTYVEHFAVDAAERGNGIGSAMLKHLTALCGEKILLEVELPTTAEAQRRILFYKRHGFTERPEVEYMQPPYAPGLEPVPMLLLTRGHVEVNRAALQPIMQRVYCCAAD